MANSAEELREQLRKLKAEQNLTVPVPGEPTTPQQAEWEHTIRRQAG